jgi:hypothetical protein
MSVRKKMTDPAKVDADNQLRNATVQSVQRVGPTHAQELRNLVGINANVRQGEPCGAMRLDFEMSCGEAPIRIGNQDFRLSLRTCFVTVLRANCEIRVGSLYEHWLETGAYTSSATEREAAESQSERGLSATAAVGGNANLSLTAKLAAGFSFGRKNKKRRSTEITNQQKNRIELIAANGQDRWQVGSSILGDARRADGLLMGAYFTEQRSKDGDPRPLCIIERAKPSESVEIKITTSAALGSLVVRSTLGEPALGRVKDAHVQLRRRGAAAAKAHTAAEAALRAQIAGLVVGKALRNAQLHAGAQLGEGVFLIAQQTLIIEGSDEAS